MQEIIIIAAMAENRVIGKDNVIPWSLKEDMAHFSRLTKGWPCIMGRKTWESLPRKPLPERINIIISGKMTKEMLALSLKSLKSSSVPQAELCPQARVLSLKLSSVPKPELCPQEPPNIIIFPSLPAAIEKCSEYEKIFICGGEAIYKQALALADKIELTVIHKQYEGDTFFPEIDAARWNITNKEDFDDFSFITYTKNNLE